LYYLKKRDYQASRLQHHLRVRLLKSQELDLQGWHMIAKTMAFVAYLCFVALLRPVGAINPGGFPNSVLTAPRGWRSWNAVAEDVTQDFITRQVDALTIRRHSVNGKPTSLLELGFDRVGIDAGWNLCTGVNGSWHDETGHFIIDKSRFPDMKAMTDHAHSIGVKMDFYLNQDGLCPEGRIPNASARTGNPHYIQDAQDTAALGFDGIKMDSGGGNDNMTLWAEAVNATGREMILESCNCGGRANRPKWQDKTPDCPYNMFRTGIDIAPSPLSTISNLLDVSEYLNVSRPGCFAYPDMLELGAPVVGPHAARYQPSRGRQWKSMCNASDGTVGDTAPRLSISQGQAQLAGWCTVSSPLILGFDLANETEYDQWFPFLSNPRALHIQSTWAGSAGRLVRSGPAFTTRVPHGATCEDMKDTRDLPEWTVWSKPLTSTEDGATAMVAALVLNTRQDKPANVTLSLGELGLSDGGGTVKETEVWSGEVTKLLNTTHFHVSLPPGRHRWVVLEAT
jgi:hypothetical protein